MRLYYTSATHAGRRENNEDSCLAILGLYAVADGMGGHAAGEVASRLAVDHLREWSRSIASWSASGQTEPVVRTCFNACNNRLLDYMRDHPETRCMGTTLTALVVQGAVATVAHVGDSRCYHVHAGRCRQLTRDHAIPGNRLVNVIGGRAGSYTGADVLSVPISVGDVFVLATDGLTLEPHEIRPVVTRCVETGANIAGTLVLNMLSKGVDDNVTVVAVTVG